MEERNNDIIKSDTLEAAETPQGVKEPKKKISPERVKQMVRLFFVAFSITLVIGVIVGVSLYLTGASLGNADSYCEKGIAAFEEGKFDKAEADLLKALEKDETHLDARMYLCRTYESEKKYAEEYETAMKGIEMSPASFDYYSFALRALCYQNKMADARALMENCDNNYVLMKIEHGKPADIKLSKNPGTYGENFELTLSTSSGSVIYYTTDGTEPTLNSTMYKSPIKVSDRLSLRAIAISDSGILSNELEAAYRVRNEDAEYTFKDETVEDIVRDTIGLYGTITYKDLDEVTTFTSEGSSGKISTLQDFEEFLNLAEVTIKGDEISDYSGLAKVEKLKTLKLINLTLTPEQLKQIGQCTKLSHLTMNNCELTDLSFASGLTSLTSVDFSDNNLSGASFGALSSLKINELTAKNNGMTSIGAIGEITTLRKLDLSNNALTAFDGISKLGKLDTVILKDNEISSTNGAAFLTSLKTADFSGNELEDISDIAGARSINTLDLSGNPVGDFSVLRSGNLTSLTAKNCGISDISGICEIISLRTLDLSGNHISDLSPVPGLSHITTLNVSGNMIKTITPLRGMGSLTSLDISGNEVSKDEAVLFNGLKINWG